MDPLSDRRPRPRAVIVGTTVALAVVAAIAAPLAASAAPVYEVETSIPVSPGAIRPEQSLYNPINESSYFSNRSAQAVIVVGPDDTVTEVPVSEPYAQTIDAAGNVWVGGTGAAGDRNVTRIAPDLTTTGIVTPSVRDLAANTATGAVVVVSDGLGTITTIAADQSTTSWVIGESTRNSGIAVDPTTGNIFLSGDRDFAAAPTQSGTWVYSPDGTLLATVPAASGGVGEPVYNPVTGRVYVPTGAAGVTVFASDLSTQDIALPGAFAPTLFLLAGGRVAASSSSEGGSVSLIGTDDTVTSFAVAGALGVAADADGAVFVSSLNQVAVIQPDGSLSSFDVPGRSGPVVFDPSADRVLVADLNAGNVHVVRVQPPAIAPITILTPADGSIVEQGFTLTGSGEPNAYVSISDGETGFVSVIQIDPDGTWSATVSARLGSGPHTWTLTQDADGSVAVLNFTIAADPMITPVSITTPTDGTATGARPTLNGAGAPGALVTVTEGSAVLGTSTVADDGTWSFTPMTDLATGGHSLTATQDVDSSTATVSFTVVAAVIPDPSASPQPTGGKLPSTGADPAPLLLTGVLVIAAGVLATVLGARRRHLSE